MTQSNEYTKPVDVFLSDRDIHFSTLLIGDDCPRHCENRNDPGIGTFPRKDHVHGQHWRVTFARGDNEASLFGRPVWRDVGQFVVDYWDSYHDAEYRWLRVHWRECMSELVLRRHGVNPDRIIQPKLHDYRHPSAYDVLSCVEKHDPGPFENWCADIGYDTDSRRAEAIHRAVVDEFKRLALFFTVDEIETLREVAQ